MKVFSNENEAGKSLLEKDVYHLNSRCPFHNKNKLCGGWCALFHVSKDENGDPHYVILGCKGTDKRLYIEKG